VCLQGPDVLHKYAHIEAVLAVHLLDVKHAKPSTAAAAAGAAAGEQGRAMFDPPLGEFVGLFPHTYVTLATGLSLEEGSVMR
jgi:hypothetical protein